MHQPAGSIGGKNPMVPDIAASGAIAAAAGPTTTVDPDETGLSTGLAATVAPAATTSNPTGTNNTAAASSSEAAELESGSSSPLNATNDPSKCHVDKSEVEDGHGNPFCKPTDGQKIIAGTDIAGTKSYLYILQVRQRNNSSVCVVTWDPSIFTSNSTITVELLLMVPGPSAGETSAGKVLHDDSVPNTAGGTFFNMSSSWLNTSTSANITFILTSHLSDQIPAEEAGAVYKDGPTITLLSNNNTNTSKPSSSSKKKGEEVGIPVGMVFLIVAVVAVAGFLYMRNRRRKGLSGSSASGQRIAKVAGGARGHHRRGSSFHDEPTRGMELQDRGGAAGGDSWDWGSPVSSPTSGSRRSNAFREEIDRQGRAR
ncbi:hypothetical protein MMC21_006404 [Puttea exsequens]|nr:hypothetical protein [Puttea exsequens]